MLTGLLAAAHTVMKVGQLLIALHNKGVGQEIVDDIRELVKDVHDAIDVHHTNAGLKDDKEV